MYQLYQSSSYISNFIIFLKLPLIFNRREIANVKNNQSVAKIFQFRPPCFSKLQSIVLEADFYSRGSKLFMYVNPFATFKQKTELRLNFSVFLNTLNLLLHVTTLLPLYDPSLGCKWLLFVNNTFLLFLRNCNLQIAWVKNPVYRCLPHMTIYIPCSIHISLSLLH